MRRPITLLVLLLLLAAVGGTAAPSFAQNSQPAAVQQAASVRADFNQDGFADLAIGAPDEDIGTAANAGAVTVLYGSATGLNATASQVFAQVGSAAESGDAFGYALATGDFNQDGFADLAASAPLEAVASIAQAGTVSILYGSASGLTATGGRLFTQVGGAVEQFDAFGIALSSGDFNHDGFADLAAGASGEAVGSLQGAGAVSILYGSASGLTATGGRLFTQVGGAIEAGDFFGYASAAGDFNHDGRADLAVGAPGEAVGSLREAGAVSILYGSASGLTATGGWLFTQVGGAIEADDRFGAALASGDVNHDSFADLAAGAPLEDVGSAGLDAGAVSILYGSASGLTATGGRLFTQIGSAAEHSDGFGWALALGDFNQDSFADLAAGAPFETVGSLPGAGAVSILYGSASGLTGTGGRLFTQIGGAVEADDVFGWAVTAGDFNQDGRADLAVGAVGEAVGSLPGAGAVSVLYGSAGGLTATGGRLYTQDSPGVPGVAEAYDGFGFALTSGGPGATPATGSTAGSTSTQHPTPPDR